MGWNIKMNSNTGIPNYFTICIFYSFLNKKRNKHSVLIRFRPQFTTWDLWFGLILETVSAPSMNNMTPLDPWLDPFDSVIGLWFEPCLDTWFKPARPMVPDRLTHYSTILDQSVDFVQHMIRPCFTHVLTLSDYIDPVWVCIRSYSTQYSTLMDTRRCGSRIFSRGEGCKFCRCFFRSTNSIFWALPNHYNYQNTPFLPNFLRRRQTFEKTGKTKKKTF